MRKTHSAHGTPARIVIAAHDVGFGDCIGLRFEYGGSARRHVLIDFGSVELPDGARPKHMEMVASRIAEFCDGKLDALVCTHRHQDHLSGFAGATGEIIRKCRPDVVIQPWTEAPDAVDEPVAKKARTTRGALAAMQEVAAAAHARLAAAGAHPRILGKATSQLKNEDAIANLQEMGRRGRAQYVHYGSDAGLSDILPGVTTTVLGPPTFKQWDQLGPRPPRSDDEWKLCAAGARYWNAWAAEASHWKQRARAAAADPFPDAPILSLVDVPAGAHWFERRVTEARDEELHAFVRALDKALNNTSVILLFEAGGKKLLFGGDAEIDCWSYALAQPGMLERLADADFYKVGHHGSRNATPLRLWNAFRRRGRAGDKDGRLITLLSTKEGRFDKVEPVPNEHLVHALERESQLLRTDGREPVQIVITP